MRTVSWSTFHGDQMRECAMDIAEDVAEDCQSRGTWWRKNKKTGEIVRTSGGTPPYPCCVHPVVHGPYIVDESDIAKHNGLKITTQ